MNSSAANQVVGKLNIKPRGSFRVIENHNIRSNSVQPFDKPDGAIMKCMAYAHMYALPLQNLPCDDVDLPEFRYLNLDFAPVKHLFKDNFNIKSYNSMWLVNKYIYILSKTDLHQVFGKNVPPDTLLDVDLAGSDTINHISAIITPSPHIVHSPDTVDDMDTNLHNNDDSDSFESTSTPMGNPITGI